MLDTTTQQQSNGLDLSCFLTGQTTEGYSEIIVGILKKHMIGIVTTEEHLRSHKVPTEDTSSLSVAHLVFENSKVVKVGGIDQVQFTSLQINLYDTAGEYLDTGNQDLQLQYFHLALQQINANPFNLYDRVEVSDVNFYAMVLGDDPFHYYSFFVSTKILSLQ